MDIAPLFIGLGLFFLAGLAADQLGRRTRVPRVTLLLALGAVAGGSGFDVVPPEAWVFEEFLATAALTMVAFLLGSALTLETLRAHGAEIMGISIGTVLITLGVVTAGLAAIGVDPGVALVLGAIATATAPAATVDALNQSGARGAFVDTLKGVVAIDDAWGLLVFAVALAVAHGLSGGAAAGTGHGAIATAAWEIGGALALGTVIGLPGAVLTGRVRQGEPLLAEALGLVFLTAGVALLMEVSFLIAGMTAGALIVNLARHHTRAFHEIEHVQWPFMLLFFLLAGASLDLQELSGIGAIGIAYIALRIAGRLAGGWVGASAARAPRAWRPWYGVALLPQAGVAIGMALVAAEALPEAAGLILTLTIGTTVVFELFGPAATLWAVRRASGASGSADDPPPDIGTSREKTAGPGAAPAAPEAGDPGNHSGPADDR
jgi:Kef-type K+ transport system membrane component KefB